MRERISIWEKDKHYEILPKNAPIDLYATSLRSSEKWTNVFI